MKGYIGGVPDIHIVSPHKTCTSFAIELKTPKCDGNLSNNQRAYLSRLQLQNHEVLISDDYDTVVTEIIEDCRGVRTQCQRCVKQFLTSDSSCKSSEIFP